MSITEIANKIHCHRATVYCELKRNRQSKTYCSQVAHTACLRKRKASAKYRIADKTIEYVRTLIEYDWSPEQVSNALKMCGLSISHEWIYPYIHEDKKRKGTINKECGFHRGAAKCITR